MVKLRAHGLAALALLIAPTVAFAQGGAFAGPTVAGIPVEFILFATVLLGVALFHHYTFPIAAGGALAIALYKIFFSPFKTGAGWSGFGLHLLHEWVILMLAIIGWHPGSTPRGNAPAVTEQGK